MWDKNTNGTWDRAAKLAELDTVIADLAKLKTYSKALQSSGYMVTNTLEDIYTELSFQHAFWVMTSPNGTAPVQVEDLLIPVGKAVNVLRHWSPERILASTELRSALISHTLNGATAELFHSPANLADFQAYDGNSDGNLVVPTFLLNAAYTRADWESTYQRSEEANGFTVQHVFTSGKVTQKLLRNFHLVELASTAPVDLALSYPILGVDDTGVLDGYRVLLMGQTDPVENGIYAYANQRLVPVPVLATSEDSHFFSAFVKDGTALKGKEFFLSRRENGTYPVQGEPCFFEAGTNYVLRSQISYRLQTDHVFTDLHYHTQQVPVLAVPFAPDVDASGYAYELSSDASALLRRFGTDPLAPAPGVATPARFLPRIVRVGRAVYAVYYDPNTFAYSLYSGTSASSTHTITPLLGEVVNFNVCDANGSVLVSYTTAYNQEYFLYTLTNGVPDTQPVYQSAQQLRDAISFTTPDGVLHFVLDGERLLCLSGGQQTVLRTRAGISELRVSGDASIVTLAWLEDGEPAQYAAPLDHLTALFGWKKTADYPVRSFTKQQAGDWEIRARQLYLRGVPLTGVTPELRSTFPRVLPGTGCTYDGINDHSVLVPATIATLKNAPGFSLELVVNPAQVNVNATVFYLGEDTSTTTVVTEGGTLGFSAPPRNYITFFAADENFFPYVQLCVDNKTVDVKATSRLSVGQAVRVTFTWDYTPTKGTGRLYFDGELVGEASDIKNVSSLSTFNLPLDVAAIPFECCYFAKSANEKYPLFRGELSDVRLWNRVLNLSQILSRLDRVVGITDPLHPNLLANWRLNDAGIAQVDAVNTLAPAQFFGGLAQDALLPLIEDVVEIQLGAEYLYVLDAPGQNIYQIELATETVSVFHTTGDPDISIRAIRLSDTGLVYVENDSVLHATASGTTTLYTQGTLLQVLDVALSHSGFLLLYMNDHRLYDVNNVLLYATPLTGLDALHVEETPSARLFYATGTDAKTRLLARANNATRLVATTPVAGNSSAVVSDVYYGISDAGTVFADFGVVALPGTFWEPTTRRVFALQARDERLLVGTLTHDNEVVVWQFDPAQVTAVPLLTRDLSPVLFAAPSGIADMSYYVHNGSEYVVLLNSDAKSIAWYRLEKDNKLCWDTLAWSYAWVFDPNAVLNEALVPEALRLTGNAFTLTSHLGANEYIATVENGSPDYGLWTSSLAHTPQTHGIIAGRAGLVFTDTDAWSVSKSNILYKEDFAAVSALVSTTVREGYTQRVWSNTAWLAGAKGRVFRTLDNGGTWTLLNSGVYHNLRDVAFFDARTGLVVGEGNTVLSTSSGGDSFQPVVVPAEVGVHDWTSVCCYREDRALVAGTSGSLLHLSKKNGVWGVDACTDAQGATGARLVSLYRTATGTDAYSRTIRSIFPLGNNRFVLAGDADYVAFLTLSFGNGVLSYDFGFTKTNEALDWEQVIAYTDVVDNRAKLLLLAGTRVYELPTPATPGTGSVTTTPVVLRYEHPTPIRRLQLLGEYLLGAGTGASLFKKRLFADTPTAFVAQPTSPVLSQDVTPFFKAGLLFLDYSVARKINLHHASGDYVTPVGDFPKDALNCFRFDAGDYVEFTDYGATNEQNNFLAYQDFFYLNRRGVAEGSTHGKMSDWRRYNKRLTALDPATYAATAVAALSFHATAGTADSFYVSTEPLVGSNLDEPVADESALSTRLHFKRPGFAPAANDVLRLTFLDPRTSVALGDRLLLTIQPQAGLGIAAAYLSGVVQPDDTLTFGQFVVEDTVRSHYDTAQIAALLLPTVRAHYADLLRLRCVVVPAGAFVTVTVAVVKADVATTVRYTGTAGSGRVAVLDELFTPEMTLELNTCSLVARNLNYFNGDLDHLQAVVADHLLGQCFRVRVTDPERVVVEGVVTDENVYYNLETNLLVSRLGEVTSYAVAYPHGSVYAPSYSLLNVLSQLNADVFTPEYAFDLPSMNLTFTTATRSPQGLFRECSIGGNALYVGQDVAGIERFKAGHFVDIHCGSQVAERVHINSVTKVPYARFPDKFRYVLSTNLDIDGLLPVQFTSGSMRVRNTLLEISNDLEFTDNQMFPLPNTHTFNVARLSRSYFNQVKTGKAYAACLLNDDQVRANASAVVYLDEGDDWNLNLINWRDDTNLSYQPVDLFEYGVDNTFKKSISLDLSNYAANGKSLALKNVELSRYNFTLIDGLTLKELESRFHWVLNADIRDATIGQDAAGLVWYSGSWLNGSWEGGTWNSGTVYNIEWLGGSFYANTVTQEFNLHRIDTTRFDATQSVWHNGTWKSGDFYDGTWLNGTFEAGTHHRGTWDNGTWRSGVWKSGTFRGGDWLDGTWLSGTFNQEKSFAAWHAGTWLGGDFENGTWKNGTWDETARVASRFGTKASYLKKAVWEYGLWKNGQFHAGTTVAPTGELVPSGLHAAAVWHNGTWDKGAFFGGTWNHGTWNSGVWHDGVLRSALVIASLSAVVLSAATLEVRFTTPHYYKTQPGALNYLLMLGAPAYEEGNLNALAGFLGTNMVPGKHLVLRIVDDYAVQIAATPDFYLQGNAPTPPGNGLTPRCQLSLCQDYTTTSVVDVVRENVPLTVLGYLAPPRVVTHWVNGSWSAGIWQMGYFNNGAFKTGIWVDGVHEGGVHGN